MLYVSSRSGVLDVNKKKVHTLILKLAKVSLAWHFQIAKSRKVGQIMLNTQNMTNLTIVSPVKMEYGRNLSISGLKMMVKSGLEKIFLEFIHGLTM